MHRCYLRSMLNLITGSHGRLPSPIFLCVSCASIAKWTEIALPYSPHKCPLTQHKAWTSLNYPQTKVHTPSPPPRQIYRMSIHPHEHTNSNAKSQWPSCSLLSFGDRASAMYHRNPSIDNTSLLKRLCRNIYPTRRTSLQAQKPDMQPLHFP